MKIVFLGTPRLAQIVLEYLVDSDFKPDLVISGEDKRIGRGQKYSLTPVKQTAQKNKIEIGHSLPEVKFDLAILVAFGQIIPTHILNIPKHGFINVHPSLLPKYRGPSPIQSAILEGEKSTGVSIIKLDKEVDHGPILRQKEIGIENDDTHESLIEKTGTIGSNLLLEILPDYMKGHLKPTAQDDKKATFTQKITKADGQIDLDKPPSKQKLNRMIKAFYPWPTVWAHLRQDSGGRAKTNSKIIKFLPKGLIQVEGKKPMTKDEFLNGYPQYKSQLDKIT